MLIATDARNNQNYDTSISVRKVIMRVIRMTDDDSTNSQNYTHLLCRSIRMNILPIAFILWLVDVKKERKRRRDSLWYTYRMIHEQVRLTDRQNRAKQMGVHGKYIQINRYTNTNAGTDTDYYGSVLTTFQSLDTDGLPTRRHTKQAAEKTLIMGHSHDLQCQPFPNLLTDSTSPTDTTKQFILEP